ncbi:MAG: substrate-binding domain-containing protein [Rickettsiales bacterium]
MKKSAVVFSALVLSGFFAPHAHAGDSFRIVGSSTVYPFVTTVAEEFGKNSEFSPPVVESTGTGGGFSLFCAPDDADRPDLANASRSIKESEKKLCAESKNNDPIEFNIGYDGIAIASNVEGPKFNVTLRQLRDALAKYVEKDGKIVENPYKKWNDVNEDLPNEKILVYGPPTTSGTRDALNDLALIQGCADDKAFAAAYPKEEDRAKACGAMREDGAYVDATENDNLIVQKLRANESAVGIFGYHFLEENAASVRGATVDGHEPTYENIADGSYPLTRPLFVYANGASVAGKKSVEAFLTELLSERALGDEGYLTYKGLIPARENIRERNREALAKAQK